jgi:tight adherence protein B
VAEEVAAMLRTGASLIQALDSAAARGGAAAIVLQAPLRAVARGTPLVDGAARWAQDAVTADEALVAEALQLCAWTSRAEPAVFDTVADTIRERAALAGELRAQTAQARASAAALALLPIGFTVLVALADHAALAFLVGTPAGWICLAVGMVLQVAGFWWMHRTIGAVLP